MNTVLVLVRTSFIRFFANKGAMIITFLVPVVLIYLFGHVFGLYRSGRSGGPTGITVAVVDQERGSAAPVLIAALKSEAAFNVITETREADGSKSPISEADARAAIRDNKYRYALIIPADVLPKDSIGLRLKFIWDPRNDIEAQTVNGLLQRAVFTKAPRLLQASLEQHAIQLIGNTAYDAFARRMAEVISASFDVDPQTIYTRFNTGNSNSSPAQPSAAAEDQMSDAMAEIFKIETEQVAGKEVKNPMASRMVGGYAVMFLLFALSASAASLFDDAKTGIFQRVLTATVTPAQILWARFLFGIGISVLQLGFLFGAGKLLFGIELLPHLLPLAVVTLATAAACTAFGMFIASIAPSAEAVGGLSTLIVLPLTAIGGAWFPVSFMPEFIQKLSRLSLVYWSVEAYTSVLWAGHSLRQVLPHIGVLSAIAIVVMAFATYRFRRSSIFA
jgi:ABC-2 type transport system permease protein